MIRSVDTASSPETTQQATPASVQPASAAGKSFASLHAKAVADQSGTGALERLSAPAGETWAPVKGDAHFARIITGPRAGQYINLTRGDRRGEVFTIEQRGGKTVHVYGSGDSAKAIDASADVDKSRGRRKIAKEAAADQPPNGETWAPVDGHNSYADILHGKRNGLFVNISGGVRDGMAFQIVKQGAKTFHVYGSGKTRQVIEIGAHRKATATGGTTATGTTSTSPTASTGGTPANTGGSTGTPTAGTTIAPADTAEPSGTPPAAP